MKQISRRRSGPQIYTDYMKYKAKTMDDTIHKYKK